MIKYSSLFVLIFIFYFQIGCKSKVEKLQYLICKDSIQYWDYEWPRENAERHGFTFSFDKKGECVKYSNAKVRKKRTLFPDDFWEGRENWHFINDSILYCYTTYNKVISYSEDTIHLADLCNNLYRSMLIRVKGDLNIIEEKWPGIKPVGPRHYISE